MLVVFKLGRKKLNKKMKYLKTFENDDQGLLGDMQGLGLSPKPIGCYISFLSLHGDNDASALGVVVIGPNLVSIAERLFREFNLEDVYDDSNEMGWKSIKDVMETFADSSREYYDVKNIYDVWEMTPRTQDIKEEVIATETLMKPLAVCEMGRKYFRDFDQVIKGSPTAFNH